MDIAEIGIAVDTSDVKLAKTDLQAIDAAFNSAERSASIFVQAFSRATARAVKDAEIIRKSSQAFVNLVNSANNVSNSYKSAEASAEAFTAELRKQEAQAIRTAQANQAAINKQLNVNQPTAISSGAGFGAIEAEIERLSQTYNKIYAASRLYESSLNELTRAHQLGVISTKQHEAAVESLNLEYQTFQAGTVTGMNRFANAAQQTAGRTNQLGVVVQQTGYQVGDFLVQVQSGQNWMVAFGQQATQLVGTLPLLSGVLGMSTGKLIAWSTGLGIAIPLITALGAAWMRTREDTVEEVDVIAEAIKKLQQETSTLNIQWNDLKFGGSGEGALAGLVQEASDLRAEIERLALVATETTGRSLPVALLAVEVAKEELDTIIAKTNALQVEVDKKIAATAQLQQANAISIGMMAVEMGHYKAIGDLERQRVARQASFAEGMSAVNNAAVKIAGNTREFVKQLEDANIKGRNFAGINLAAGVIAASAAALNLATNLGISLATANALAALGNQGVGGNDPSGKVYGGRGSTQPSAEDLYSMKYGYTKSPTSGSGGGGGGGGSSIADQLEQELDAIRQSSAAKAELEIEEYEKRQETLKSALDRKMITLAEYNSLELQIAKDHAAALTEIDVYRYGSALDQAGQFFGDMAAATQGGGEKLVRISRIFGAAEALINAYKAASQVLASPMPWFAKIPAAVGVLSAGMGFVNAIKSGSGSGSGGGGGRGSASVSSATAPQAPQRVLVQGINPDDIFTGQWLSNFFDNFYKENNDRGAVFMVNR